MCVTECVPHGGCPVMDEVSTARGSGWVYDQARDIVIDLTAEVGPTRYRGRY